VILSSDLEDQAVEQSAGDDAHPSAAPGLPAVDDGKRLLEENQRMKDMLAAMAEEKAQREASEAKLRATLAASEKDRADREAEAAANAAKIRAAEEARAKAEAMALAMAEAQKIIADKKAADAAARSCSSTPSFSRVTCAYSCACGSY
jgi:colicin import membrane protein